MHILRKRKFKYEEGGQEPPSNYFFKKINATASNTYTYEFELICGPDNSLKNFKFLQKLDYCRVIEGTGGNTKFVNYLRNPIDRRLKHSVSGHTISFVSLHATNTDGFIYKSNERLTRTETSWEWHGLQKRKYVHDYYTTWYYKFDKYNNLSSLRSSSERRDRWWDN